MLFKSSNQARIIENAPVAQLYDISKSLNVPRLGDTLLILLNLNNPKPSTSKLGERPQWDSDLCASGVRIHKQVIMTDPIVQYTDWVFSLCQVV